MYNLQKLHVEQEEKVGGRKVVFHGTGKGIVLEEVKQPTHICKVFHQRPQI